MITTLNLPLATGFFLLYLTVVEYSECIPLRSKRAFSYIANETACTVDHIVYRAGDPIPTDDPCETCRCRPPGFTCVLRECEIKTGCRAIRRIGECCPLYRCGCEHNGKYYSDGERIPNAESPCYSCYCQGSSITCSLADCKFRFDCEPEYIIGECCPRYDHCPPEFDFEPITVRSTLIPRLSTAFVPTTVRPTSPKSTTISTTVSLTNSSSEYKQIDELPTVSGEVMTTASSVPLRAVTPEVSSVVSSMSSTASLPTSDEATERGESSNTTPAVSDLQTTELNRQVEISLTTSSDLESLNVTTVIPTLNATESSVVVELRTIPAVETTSLRTSDTANEIGLDASLLNITQSALPSKSTVTNISVTLTTESPTTTSMLTHLSGETTLINSGEPNSTESIILDDFASKDKFTQTDAPINSLENGLTPNITVLAELLPETTTTAASLEQLTTSSDNSEELSNIIVKVNITSELEERISTRVPVDPTTTTLTLELTTERGSDTESNTQQPEVTTSSSI